MNEKRLKKIDWFIIAVLILCVAGIGVRIFCIGSNYPTLGKEKLVISFSSRGVTENLTSLVLADDVLKLKDCARLGTLADGYSVIPAGAKTSGISGSGGDLYILSGDIAAVGKLFDNGAYVSGCGIIGVGDVLTLQAENYTITVTVTGITKQ